MPGFLLTEVLFDYVFLFGLINTVVAPDRTWPGRRYELMPGAIQRIALMIEYNGNHFHGWQRQASPAVATVQAGLERALSEIANHSIKVFCAGRTDAGVHAVAQVVHFDTQSNRELKAWVLGANSQLPRSIRVVWAAPVNDYFHARYSAVARQYQYFIYNSKLSSALFAGQLTHYAHPLDAELMHAESQCLLGEHDFSAFRAASCQSNTAMRFVESISVSRKNSIVCIEIKANAFLLHMVRNIAGSLMAIGSGRHPVGWLESVLQSRDRNIAEATAKPDGLYLQKVDYPQAIGLPRCEQLLPFVSDA